MIGSADEFVRLRHSADPALCHRAAHEPAHLDVWLDVMARYPRERFWVAQNKSVPLEVLAILARDPDPKVRLMVSMKRKLTPDLLAQLATDQDEAVRLQVARHRNTPRPALARLAQDEWQRVAAAAAERMR
ncbi:MAG TPA: hypothetical protein VJT31_25880 [Rugosimonospora sp.]|nr:hypothetical protein [Rugosimonospora sp.]